MFAHQNRLMEGFVVLLLVLIFDPLQVHFRATHHDTGQHLGPGSLTLKGDKESQRDCGLCDYKLHSIGLLPTMHFKSFLSILYLHGKVELLSEECRLASHALHCKEEEKN